MASINLSNVSVDIPVYNSSSRSFKKKILGMATGGRICSDNKGVTTVRSLSDINLKINANERVGLLGENGAGKSTLLRVLGKVYIPTSGQAQINGSIGSLISISLGIDPESTGMENIFLRAALLGIERDTLKKKLDEIIDFSELGEFIHMPVRTYSTGMHMRLAFAVSTMIRPDILLMDEWLSVGDKSFQKKAEIKLNNLIENSNILVIASHSRNLIERCCTRVIWLEKGMIKTEGKPSEICARYFN